MDAEDHLITHEHDGVTERFLTAMPRNEETAVTLIHRVVERVGGGRCISVDVFGAQPEEATLALLREVLPAPVTWVVEQGAQPGVISAVQAWVADGASVEHITHDGRVVGSLFEDAHTSFVRLGGLTPDPGATREAQARVVLDTMLALLRECRLDFSHVVRTWFYITDILGWYRDFNITRDGFFREHHVFDGLVPASTGMGGGNPREAALTAGLLAVRAKSPSVRVARVDSPLQCPAWDYGSSFSRAVDVTTPSMQRLFISGTASIAQEGHTLYKGDVAAQMRQTFKVVEAILEAQGMQWADVTRACGYFKPDAAGETALLEKLAPPVPITTVVNHVCRGDLLFEAEMDAIVCTGGKDKGA